MAKEDKLFSVKCELEDKDFEEVYRIYMASEHKDRFIPLIICALLAVGFLVLSLVLRNITMVFYAIACVLIAVSYRMIPTNKKFLATNRLQFGEIREMDFYPHEVTTFEWLDDDETISEEEREEATTRFSTNSLKAFENKQGILFADGTIVNNFLYVPKRSVDDETLAMLIDFAKNSCAGGYELLEMESLLGEQMDLTEDIEVGDSSEDLCNRYYGAGNIRIFDENGNRIRVYEEDDDSDAADMETDDDPDCMDFSEISPEDTETISEDTEDFTEIPDTDDDEKEKEENADEI